MDETLDFGSMRQTAKRELESAIQRLESRLDGLRALQRALQGVDLDEKADGALWSLILAWRK